MKQKRLMWSRCRYSPEAMNWDVCAFFLFFCFFFFLVSATYIAGTLNSPLDIVNYIYWSIMGWKNVPNLRELPLVRGLMDLCNTNTLTCAVVNAAKRCEMRPYIPLSCNI